MRYIAIALFLLPPLLFSQETVKSISNLEITAVPVIIGLGEDPKNALGAVTIKGIFAHHVNCPTRVEGVLATAGSKQPAAGREMVLVPYCDVIWAMKLTETNSYNCGKKADPPDSASYRIVTKTNSSGKFVFSDLPPGEYALLVIQERSEKGAIAEPVQSRELREVLVCFVADPNAKGKEPSRSSSTLPRPFVPQPLNVWLQGQ